MDWLKETLIGLGFLLILLLVATSYIILKEISLEETNIGKVIREFGKYCWKTYITYLIICSFMVPLIALIIWLFS